MPVVSRVPPIITWTPPWRDGMTAEIAIINKEAIAVAADSAVTMAVGVDKKVFPSANKIFTLSKYHPVGIMVYGSDNLLGAPWELIVKVYRARLGRKHFATLQEYLDDFIGFLCADTTLFPQSQRDEYLKTSVHTVFRFLRETIENEVESIVDERGEITREEIEGITASIIETSRTKCEEANLFPMATEDDLDKLRDRLGELISTAQHDVFQELPLTESLAHQLIEIAESLFVKSTFRSPGRSGVVIAGFGDKDVLPRLRSIETEGIVDSRLLYRNGQSVDIDLGQKTAAIVPFAQREMVDAFMEGVDPDYQASIERGLSQILMVYPEAIVDSIEEINDAERDALKTRLDKLREVTLTRYQEEMRRYRNLHHVDPIIKVVAMLPKDELAEMAESLVSLTAFKRKVSWQAETVGGPIDVAVISKGDGFIWVKRKHYFVPELNSQFFANYYREYDGEGQE